MNKLVLIAGLAGIAALSGCTKTEEPAVVDGNETATVVPVNETAATQPTPGKYEVTDAAGKVTTTTINADGTFQAMDGDTVLASGTVSTVGGKDCFDPEGDDPARCYTAGEPDADGKFTVTADDGSIETVRPIAE